MTLTDSKHASAVDEAVVRLLSRASNSRGLAVEDVRPRVISAVEKYLRQGKLERSDITNFIDEIRSDDLCLIIACEKGDETAWEELVANFDSTVRSAARKVTSNAEDADDLASSIWAELYGLRQDAEGRKKSKLTYYSGRGSLGGWLRAVVSQLAIDQFRKESRFVHVEEDREFDSLANDASENDGQTAVPHYENPETLLAEKQTAGDVAESLQAAIASLKPEDRLILKLYYFDDVKLKDIGTTFGFHEATASRKLVRIQSEIRKAVEANLRQQHGWSDSEVKRYLSDTAAKLGMSFEKLLGIAVMIAALQDFYLRFVL